MFFLSIPERGCSSFLLLAIVDLQRHVVLSDSVVTAKAIDIGDLVYGHGVCLVERRAVHLLHGGDGLAGRVVLAEGQLTPVSIIPYLDKRTKALDLGRESLFVYWMDRLGFSWLAVSYWECFEKPLLRS